MNKDIQDKTPSEALMEVMDQFSRDEPSGFVVVWEGEEFIHVMRNNATNAKTLGLLRLAEEMVIHRFNKLRDAEDER